MVRAESVRFVHVTPMFFSNFRIDKRLQTDRRGREDDIEARQ